jgi:hypothetical protein
MVDRGCSIGLSIHLRPRHKLARDAWQRAEQETDRCRVVSRGVGWQHTLSSRNRPRRGGGAGGRGVKGLVGSQRAKWSDVARS